METIYVKGNLSITIVQALPSATDGDTVTIKIRRNSDDKYWNFSSEVWQDAAVTGNMVYDHEIYWKVDFTTSSAENDEQMVTITHDSIIYPKALISTATPPSSETSGDTLTTVSNVKAFIHLETTAHDTLIGNLITRISKEVKNHCDRDLVDDDYTEYYDGSGDTILMVDQYPINSISAIYDDIERDFASSSEIDSDDIIFTEGTKDAKAGIIHLDGVNFTLSKQNVKIQYNAGYVTIPGDLEQAVIRLVAAELAEGQDSIDIQVEGQEDTPARLRKIGWEKIDAKYVRQR